MSFAFAHKSKNKSTDGKSSMPSKTSFEKNSAFNRGSRDSTFRLQRTVGNQAVQKLAHSSTSGFDFAKIGIQPKLKISKPSDPYEEEADRVAEQLMPLSVPRLQRRQNQMQNEVQQAKPLTEGKATDQAMPISAPSIVDDVLSSIGQPLLLLHKVLSSYRRIEPYLNRIHLMKI